MAKKERNRFEAFYKSNLETFYLYALHVLNDEEECHDIVSDVMEYVYENFSERDDKQWFRYCISAIRNKCIDVIKHKIVQRNYADFYAQILEQTEVNNRMEEDERLQEVMKLIDTLKPKTKLVLTECYINHKSYKEVADELEISVNGVKKHIVTALRAIREGIDKKYKI